MSPTERAVLRVLRKHMPEILASSVRRRAQSAIGIAEGRLGHDDLRRFITELRTGMRLFAEPAVHAVIVAELTALVTTEVQLVPERLSVCTEQDISRVRMRAREMAVALGGGAFVIQRAATVASELSRNIVTYAKEGYLDLSPQSEPAPSLTIVATDRGPGIANIELVLSGKYRSKTGLGKGLLGVQKLASRFEIQSDRTGTRVEAEIAFA